MMKLVIKTSKLQEMMSKAVKGASNNKLIPITGLMEIALKEGVLTLTTTDASNTVKIIENNIEGEDFNIVVQVDTFSKLVAKTTSENMTLTLKDNSLVIKGNGTYNIELPLDEEGGLIKYPKYRFKEDTPESKIKLSTINQVLKANKAAIATTMDMPCLTGYYFSDKVITTDSFKMCGNDIKVFENDVLLPSELVELLGILTEEDVTVQQAGDYILFTTKGATIHGSVLDGIEDYPVEAISQYLDTEFENGCKVAKASLLNVLDRLSLFVSTYDRNGVYLTFTKEGILLNSRKSNGSELIQYQDSQNFTPFTCCVDIELLKSQIVAQDGEVVHLWYGNNKALKMTFNKITQIVALLEDDRQIAEIDGTPES